MMIAGEASGDALAAELIIALREARSGGAPLVFFGAGGPKMAEAGMELLTDLTSHAVVGLFEALKNYRRFRAIFHQLLGEAVSRKPALVILVDFSGFNRRFASALRARAARSKTEWRPKIVYYVSPQVWASRPGRARTLERDVDLLLAIFPFEQAWYAAHAPKLRVEFVGHPILSRYAGYADRIRPRPELPAKPSILLLPGSRQGELKRHLPVLLEAAIEIERRRPARWSMVLPDQRLLAEAKTRAARSGLDIRLSVGGLAGALLEADLALASTGTVTMECAFFRVPAVTLYKTSWSTYQIGKRIIKVGFVAMPNLLAGEAVFPEFVQDAATGPRLAEAAMDLLEHPERRARIQEKLAQILSALGPPGASRRAAEFIISLIEPPRSASTSPKNQGSAGASPYRRIDARGDTPDGSKTP
jgi:lipid-A-disaccharide synthase